MQYIIKIIIICSREHESLFCHFKNEIYRLKVSRCIETRNNTTISCIHSMSSKPSSMVQEVQSCTEYIGMAQNMRKLHFIGCDYKPIKTLPDHLVSYIVANMQ